MKALILAAGRGSRLSYKTKHKPKALVKIDNKEILYYQLTILRKLNITDICIVVGYKANKIIHFIRKQKNLNFKIILNKIYDKTDSAYSYSLAKDFVKNADYIHMNCDIIFNKTVLKNILNSPKKNILSSRSDIELSEKMDLIKTKNSKIIKFDNKFYPEAEKKVFGLGKISPRLSKAMINLIELDIKKKKYNKKCFSYFNKLCNKYKIYSMSFKKNQLREINYLNDIKNRK